jgi:hypothetical protein
MRYKDLEDSLKALKTQFPAQTEGWELKMVASKYKIMKDGAAPCGPILRSTGDMYNFLLSIEYLLNFLSK